MILAKALFIFLISTKAVFGYQKTFTVFDVRKTLPLNENQPVFKDYYINLGTDHGAKPGMVVTAFRRVPVIDIYRNQAQADLIIEVGKMKIIHSQNSMSVARVVSLAKEGSIPVVQFETIMIGDRVELGGQIPKENEPKDEMPPPPPNVKPDEIKKDAQNVKPSKPEVQQIPNVTVSSNSEVKQEAPKENK